MADELLDARGVKIDAGDTVIYGFGVGRSVAMCEAVVLADSNHTNDPGAECPGCETQVHSKVSLTSSGRVRLRVVRRSCGSGEKPVVDVAPDRLVVLKHPEWTDGWDSGSTPSLPPSPLPTQNEEARKAIEANIRRYTAHLRAKLPPPYWGDDMDPGASPEVVLADYRGWCARQLAHYRKKLKALDG